MRAKALDGNLVLSLRPTELADGLALKELRYGRGIASRDYLDRFAPSSGDRAAHWFPRSPWEAATRPTGIRQGLFEAREYNCALGRVETRFDYKVRGAGRAISGYHGAAAIPLLRTKNRFAMGTNRLIGDAASGYDSRPGRGAAATCA